LGSGDWGLGKKQGSFLAGSRGKLFVFFPITNHQSPINHVFVASCNKIFPNFGKTGKSSKRNVNHLIGLLGEFPP
jgi:hypothetical protein